MSSSLILAVIDGYSLQRIHEKDKFFKTYDFKVANSPYYAVVQDKSPFLSEVELVIIAPGAMDEDVIDYKRLGSDHCKCLFSA